MHWSSYTVGGLLEVVAVMLRGKTLIKKYHGRRGECMDKLHCGDLLELVTVMLKGKTPWARGDGLGLGVDVRSRVVLSKCIGQVTLWGLTGSGSCDA